MRRTSGRTFFDPEQHGKRRDDNTGLLGKLAFWGMKYNWIVTLGFGLFLILGFGFKTPRDAFAELRDAISEVKHTANLNKDVADAAMDTLSVRITRSDIEQSQLRSLIESSITAQCLYYPKKVSRTALLPCARLFRERGIE